MKRSIVLLFAALFAVTAPLAPARADVSVPIDFFYDALSPSGDWIYVENYGYVWQPLVARDANWAPYADGYWAYTDAGWTWISNEDFGWITYHYGRWMRLQHSWVWVPGTEWAPAWVSWRQTQGQIGWAPLPPEAAWVSNIGFGGWTDSYYDVGPAYYNFVPMTAFATSASLMPFIMDRNRNYTFYDQSVNITHTHYQPNAPSHIFVGGPDPARLDRMGSNPVRRLTLRHDDEGFRRNWLDRPGDRSRNMGNPSRIDHDQLVIAAPSIRRDGPQGLPGRVREHINQAMIDRGWRGAGDSDRLRQQQREELARTRPQTLPEKNRQPITSMAPPPAVGRVLNPEERGGAGSRNDPRHVAEEVRHAVPLPNKNRPGAPTGPNDANEQPGNRGNTPHADMPRERRPGGLPGEKPSERAGEAPGIPPSKNTPPAERPTPRLDPKTPEAPPPQMIPNQPGQQPGRPGRRGGFPGNREQRPDRDPNEQPPSRPNVVPPPAQSATPAPRNNPVPMPQNPQPEQQRQPQARPMPTPHVNNPPAAAPQPQPHVAPPHNAPPQGNPAPQPQNPGPQGPGPGGPGGRHGKRP